MRRLSALLVRLSVIFILLGILLVSVGIFTGAKKTIYFADGRIKISNDKQYEYQDYNITGIKNVDIDISNATIILKESQDTKFGINIQLNNQTNKPKIEIKDGAVNIKTSEGIFFTMNFFSLFDDEDNQIVLTVPQDSALNEIKLKTSNGKIHIEGISCEHFEADTSNGAITLRDTQIKDGTRIHSSNGEIHIQGDFNSVTKLKTVNGRITAEGTFMGDVKLQTANGHIIFQNSISRKESNIYTKTNSSTIVNSSKISGTFTEENDSPNSVSAVTSNGTITIKFPDEP